MVEQLWAPDVIFYESLEAPRCPRRTAAQGAVVERGAGLRSPSATAEPEPDGLRRCHPRVWRRRRTA